MRLETLRGEVIADRFRLGAMVGKGGYGAVFEAEQLSMGRRCAVKLLLPGRAMDDAVEKRFRAEARMTSRLTHPHTVVVYDFGVDESTELLFLATEFLDGWTLRDILDRRSVIDVATALSILEQVAGSLSDAHSRGLVHRDIKPQNIMLVDRAGRDNFVKVIDFGIAKVLEGSDGRSTRLTRTGMLIGTPQFIAPEQLVGGALDGRADQYALAVIAYRMLTGRNPFEAGTQMETAMRHLNDRPLPLRTYRPDLDVSADFEDVLLKALEKSAEHRYGDINAFMEALNESRDDYLKDQPRPLLSSTTDDDDGGDGDTVVLDSGDVDEAIDVSSDKKAEPTAVLGEASEPGGGSKDSAPVVEDPQLASGAARDVAAPQNTAQTVQAGMPSATRGDEVSERDDLQQRENADRPSTTSESPTVEEKTTTVVRKRETTQSLGDDSSSESERRGRSMVAAGAVIAIITVGLAMVTVSDDADSSAVASSQNPVEAGADRADERSGDESLVPAAIGVTAADMVYRPAQRAEFDIKPAIQGGKDGVSDALQQAIDGALQRAEAIEEQSRTPGSEQPAPARLTVTLIPWGTLYVDGAPRSDETRQQVELEPGSHRLTMRQHDEIVASQVVDVAPGQSKLVALEAEFDD